jgi:hypothetical protein
MAVVAPAALAARRVLDALVWLLLLLLLPVHAVVLW